MVGATPGRALAEPRLLQVMRHASPLERLAAQHRDLVRGLQARFLRKLSWEDCQDVVQDALVAAAASPVCAGLDVVQLEAWVRKAAYHLALDVVKVREGRGRVRRSAPADIDDLAAILADPTGPADQDLADEEARAHDRQQVAEALADLPTRDALVVTLRHGDGLPVAACAAELGVTQPAYERLHTGAMRRLRDRLIAAGPHRSCAEARRLIDTAGTDPLDRDDAARRDAHLAGCLRCRAYERRARGLLGLLPLPVVLAADRLGVRAHTILPSLGSPSEATVGAGGGGLLGVGAVKLAALLCAGAVATGTCNATLSALDHDDRRPRVRGTASAGADDTTTAGPVVRSQPSETPVATRSPTLRARQTSGRRSHTSPPSAAPVHVDPVAREFGRRHDVLAAAAASDIVEPATARQEKAPTLAASAEAAPRPSGWEFAP